MQLYVYKIMLFLDQLLFLRSKKEEAPCSKIPDFIYSILVNIHLSFCYSHHGERSSSLLQESHKANLSEVFA